MSLSKVIFVVGLIYINKESKRFALLNKVGLRTFATLINLLYITILFYY